MPQRLQLDGLRFGRWTVLHFSHMVYYRRRKGGPPSAVSYFSCECDCGTERDVCGSTLIRKRNPSLSCGCRTQEMSRVRLTGKFGEDAIGYAHPGLGPQNIATNLRGKRFGQWLAIGPEKYTAGQGPKWICECACGTRRAVAACTLVSGRSTCCGRGICRPRDKQGRIVSKAA